MAIENDMEFSIFPSDQIIVQTPVDSEMSPDSENPVSAKVIYEELAKKADKANTLAGYFIEDAYTKAEIKELLEKSAGGITFIVVEKLPTENINKNTIYLVPNSTSQNNDYDEYIYINGKWEKFGGSDDSKVSITWVDKGGEVPSTATSNSLCFKIM